jgi:rhamnose utilization protein RhaD (predicted bifunctional aldolase and dehydrogenase)
MHAVLPHKVVIHVHSVNAIAWAVREDAPEQIGARLSDFHWQWIPYVRSGPDLARRVHHAVSRFQQTSVLLLGNHGLVVCGESCQAAEQLLADVESQLQITPRSAPEPRFPRLEDFSARSDWSLPADSQVHALATDPVARRILSRGFLYPCQAIFLPSTVRVPQSSPLNHLASFRQHQEVLFMEDCGLLCSKDMTRAEAEMLSGLASVVQRIDSSATLRYLADSEVIEILNRGAENYRKVANVDSFSKASAMSV